MITASAFKTWEHYVRLKSQHSLRTLCEGPGRLMRKGIFHPCRTVGGGGGGGGGAQDYGQREPSTGDIFHLFE